MMPSDLGLIFRACSDCSRKMKVCSVHIQVKDVHCDIGLFTTSCLILSLALHLGSSAFLSNARFLRLPLWRLVTARDSALGCCGWPDAQISNCEQAHSKSKELKSPHLHSEAPLLNPVQEA